MNRPQLKLKIVRHLLKKRGTVMTIDLVEALGIHRSSIALALQELREAGVIESSQGIPGVTLALPREALTAGLVLGAGAHFVDPKTPIDDLP